MKTSAVVPVFNEERTIRKVLETLVSSNLIDDVVVVNDSSTDNSLKEIRSIKSKKIGVISLKKNVGQSDAYKIGIASTKADLIFFCDGDLNDFHTQHIEQILTPIIQGNKGLSVGLRDYGKLRNFFYKKGFYPVISGEGAIPYDIFNEAKKDPLMKKYCMTLVLNEHCQSRGIPVYKQIMEGVSHTTKLKKWDNGFLLLIKEIFEIAFTLLALKTRRIINSIR